MATDRPPISLDTSSPAAAESVTPTDAHHQRRKPSVGDASQLFGAGGSGLDDFFGTASFANRPSQPPGFGTLEEESDSNQNPATNSLFPWSADPHPISHNAPFDDFYSTGSASAQPTSSDHYQPYQPLASGPYSHLHSTTPNPTLPHHQPIAEASPDLYNHYPTTSHYPDSTLNAEPTPLPDPPYADYPGNVYPDSYPEQPYGQDVMIAPQTGLGISSGSSAHLTNHRQASFPDYNPYNPSQTYVNSNPYVSSSSHQSTLSYDSGLHTSDAIPRSASVAGYQSVLSDTNRPPLNHFNTHHSTQSQPILSHQASAASLTRPKAFDAYDPPPIRKKKIVTPSATASLPSSPALGYAQPNQFGWGNSPTPSGTHTPPPPTKQRSISGPAQAPPGSHYAAEQPSAYLPGSPHQNPYNPSPQSAEPQPAQSLHAPNLNWTAQPNHEYLPTPSDNSYQSPQLSNGPDAQTSSLVNPYNPNPSFLSHSSAYQSSSGSTQPAPSTCANDDPYAAPEVTRASYNLPNGRVDSQQSHDPYAPPIGMHAEAYRPAYGTHPAINGRESPLSGGHKPPSSPPIGNYVPEVVPVITSPKLGHGPPSPTGLNSMSATFDRKPKRSSPLKMAVSVDEELEKAHAINEDMDTPSSQDQIYSRHEDASHPPVTASSLDDFLVAATQNLTLTTSIDPSAAGYAHDGQIALTSAELTGPNKFPGSSDTEALAVTNRHGLPKKAQSTFNGLMTVPAVMVQPATPEMSLSEVPEPSPTTTTFDVLADLSESTAARSAEDPNHSINSSGQSPYGYNPAGPAVQESGPFDYGCEYGYGSNFKTSHEDSPTGTNVESHGFDYSSGYGYEPNQTSNMVPPPQPQDNYHTADPPAFFDQYAPQADSARQEANPYNPVLPPQGSFSQHVPTEPQDVYDPYSGHSYQSSGLESYESYQPAPTDVHASSVGPPTRPSSRMLTSDGSQIPMVYGNGASRSPRQSASAPSDHEGDPMLQRLNARIPLASFGFGGKIVTVFPSNGDRSSFASGGYEDPYNTAPKATSSMTVQIQKISEVISASELQAFPGPLFMEGGSKSSIGKKKKEISRWLDSRLDESEKECSYLQNTSQTKTSHGPDSTSPESSQLAKVEEAHDKLLVLSLLRILIENDGKLAGIPKAEESVRNALNSLGVRSPAETTGVGISHPVESLVADPGFPTTVNRPTSPSLDTVASYTVRASGLDTLQTLLSHGDRPNALKFALDQRMWAHALVIANSLGNDTWRDTVREFVRFELGNPTVLGKAASEHNTSNGRESLRTLYSLFAGAGASAMEEFIPPTVLLAQSFTHPGPSPSPSSLPNPYGLSTNVPHSAVNSRASSPVPIPKLPEVRQPVIKLSNDTLKQWRSTVALTIANRVPGTAAFLLHMGDMLLGNGRVHAAHACYLLSNPLSPLIALENGNRITLLGSDPRTPGVGPGLNVEAVMFSEVLEFALSLAVVPKGQDSFIGIPHLQGFKLAMGHEYATAGLVTTAHKYCEALAATMKLSTRPCMFYHPALTDQIKALSGRLSAAPLADKGSSWIARKMPRPTLDNVWQTLEGRVHKFVAGDDEGSAENAGNGAVHSNMPNQALGPFSHYSSISPGGSSGSLSRVQSSNDLRYENQTSTQSGPFQHAPLLQRPASGGGFSSTIYDKDPRQRSTSAMVSGYSSSSSWYPNSDSDTHTTTPAQPLLTQPHPDSRTDDSDAGASAAVVPNGGGGGWWEAASQGGTPVNASAATFTAFDAGTTPDDGSGFIDPMASFGIPTLSTGATPDFATYRNNSHATYDDNDDDDDLGLGNSNRQRQRSAGQEVGDDSMNQDGSETTTPKTNVSTLKADDKALKSSPSSSWLGRLFRRDAPQVPASGPVKANLGEEVSLVYDPETKRWVSRKAGQAPTTAGPITPPPPPARAQTASPTSASRSPGPSGQSPMGAGVPPPPPISRSFTASPGPVGKADNRLSQPTPLRNSTSAMDLGPNVTATPSPPPLLPPATLQSNELSPSGPPSSNNLVGSKKPATKKNIRSRYVEIR